MAILTGLLGTADSLLGNVALGGAESGAPPLPVEHVASWQDDWRPTEDLYHPATQDIDLSEYWDQTSFFNWGRTQDAEVGDVWFQTDTFTHSYSAQSWQDDWRPVTDYYVGDTLVIPREWSDDWEQIDQFIGPENRWYTDTWNQTDLFTLDTIWREWRDIWEMHAYVRGPVAREWTDYWVPTNEFEEHDLRQEWSETWTPAEEWGLPGRVWDMEWSETMQYDIDFLDPAYTTLLGFQAWLGWSVDAWIRPWTEAINFHESWQIDQDHSFSDSWVQTDIFRQGVSSDDVYKDDTPGDQTWIAQWSETWSMSDAFVEVCGNPFQDDWYEKSGVFTYIHDQLPVLSQTFALADVFLYEYGSLYGSTSKASAPTYVATTGTFTLIDDTVTLVLRNPRFGNTQSLEFQRAAGATRSGTPYLARRAYWPAREMYKYEIAALTDTQLTQILEFIERNVGCYIYWVDHHGIYRGGYISEPASPAIRKSKSRGKIVLQFVGSIDKKSFLVDGLTQTDTYTYILEAAP